MKKKHTHSFIKWARLFMRLEHALALPHNTLVSLYRRCRKFFLGVRSSENFKHYRDLKLLAILKDLVQILEREGIAYWVTGGYAYISFPEMPLRHHKDLDLAVACEEMPKVIKILEKHGFRFTQKGPYFWESTVYGELVEFFTFAKDGDTVLSGSTLNDVRYPYSFLSEGRYAEVSGIRFKTFSPAGLAFFAWTKRPDDPVVKQLIEKNQVAVRTIPASRMVLEACGTASGRL